MSARTFSIKRSKVAGALQTEGHHFKLVQSLANGKGSLWTFFWRQLNLPVAAPEVEGAEPAGPSNVIEGIINPGQWSLRLEPPGECLEDKFFLGRKVKGGVSLPCVKAEIRCESPQALSLSSDG
ncbi:unnamed protein product [Merluccius merluccius]